MRKILIGGAWPYANGSLHIGHVAGLLPGDVLARYHRAAGDQVHFVSGSDCHGTPVAIRAKQENRTPLEMPWVTRTTGEATCKNTLYQCVQIIANLAVLLYPFLPFSSEKVCGWLHISNCWEKQTVPAGYHLPEIEVLFQRIDKKVIEEESEKLKERLGNLS